MNDLLKKQTKSEKIMSTSPILLMLQAEELTSRGRGNDYEYRDDDYVDYYIDQDGDWHGNIDEVVIEPPHVDYYHDQDQNIYGMVDEVVVTGHRGSSDVEVSWGQDDWENDYINHYGENDSNDPYNGTGGSGSGNHTSDHYTANSPEVAVGKEFADSLQKGNTNVQLTPEVLDGISTMFTVTGLVNTVAETLKQDIGLLGKIGSVLGQANFAYSLYSVIINFTDGEDSIKDYVNGSALLCSGLSFFCPAFGFLSLALTVSAIAAPGDQKSNQHNNSQY